MMRPILRWWRGPAHLAEAPAGRPPAIYRPEFWRLGLLAVRLIPLGLARALGALGCLLYFAIHPRRRRVVVENFLPVFDGDRARARRTARRLFIQFGHKLVNLLRHEGGAPMDYPLTEWSGWDRLTAAQARGKGVLLVTLHLGDWEVGGTLLAGLGVRPVVLTQAEPGQGFTDLRKSSRARWGIETLVVGNDAFAPVEIIKRLQAGAVVALLADRPPPATAVSVTLFGRPFLASISAAELARASGCAIVQGYVIRHATGYGAHVLPEIEFDRRSLGDRAARIRLTQEIMRAFEPAIRQHAEQWYHFVPLWPYER